MKRDENRPLDVLHVITDTARRGGQVHATHLHAALEQRGVAVRTVALTQGTSTHGLKVVPTLGPSRLAPQTLKRLRNEMRQARMIVGFGSTTMPACVLAGLGTTSSFVYLSVGTISDWANTALRRIRVRWLLLRAQRVVVLWPAAAHALTTRFGVPPERIAVIPTAVDAKPFAPVGRATRRRARIRWGLASDMPTVLVIGALSPEKNVGKALEVVGALQDCQLLVAGDGPERSRLEARAAELAPGRVRFAGALDNPQEAYRSADLVLLTSRSEGLPAVLIEAGFCGLPVVASNVGGIPEIVRHDHSGLLVAPDASADQWATAIRKALADADRLGEAARQHALATFEAGKVAEQWQRLLSEVASATR